MPRRRRPTGCWTPASPRSRTSTPRWRRASTGRWGRSASAIQRSGRDLQRPSPHVPGHRRRALQALAPARGQGQGGQARAEDRRRLVHLREVKIHHVGVAVANLDEGIALYTSIFGARVTHRATVEGIEGAFPALGTAELEHIAPTRPDSPLSKFLADRGPGLHHVAYAAPDIKKALSDAAAAGLELIDTEPRIGLHGVPIAFIHPKSVGGVLTEFVEI